MPKYVVTDSESGRTLELTGESPPTESELVEIFSSLTPVDAKPIEAFTTGALQEVSFGLAPQIEAGVRDFPGRVAQLGERAGRLTGTTGTRKQRRDLNLENLGEFESSLPQVEQRIATLAQENPGAFSAGETAGFVVPLIVPGVSAAKVAVKAAKLAAPVLKKTFKLTKEAAASALPKDAVELSTFMGATYIAPGSSAVILPILRAFRKAKSKADKAANKKVVEEKLEEVKTQVNNIEIVVESTTLSPSQKVGRKVSAKDLKAALKEKKRLIVKMQNAIKRSDLQEKETGLKAAIKTGKAEKRAKFRKELGELEDETLEEAIVAGRKAAVLGQIRERPTAKAQKEASEVVEAIPTVSKGAGGRGQALRKGSKLQDMKAKLSPAKQGELPSLQEALAVTLPQKEITKYMKIVDNFEVAEAKKTTEAAGKIKDPDKQMRGILMGLQKKMDTTVSETKQKLLQKEFDSVETIMLSGDPVKIAGVLMRIGKGKPPLSVEKYNEARGKLLSAGIDPQKVSKISDTPLKKVELEAASQIKPKGITGKMSAEERSDSYDVVNKFINAPKEVKYKVPVRLKDKVSELNGLMAKVQVEIDLKPSKVKLGALKQELKILSEASLSKKKVVMDRVLNKTQVDLKTAKLAEYNSAKKNLEDDGFDFELKMTLAKAGKNKIVSLEKVNDKFEDFLVKKGVKDLDELPNLTSAKVYDEFVQVSKSKRDPGGPKEQNLRGLMNTYFVSQQVRMMGRTLNSLGKTSTLSQQLSYLKAVETDLAKIAKSVGGEKTYIKFKKKVDQSVTELIDISKKFKSIK